MRKKQNREIRSRRALFPNFSAEIRFLSVHPSCLSSVRRSSKFGALSGVFGVVFICRVLCLCHAPTAHPSSRRCGRFSYAGAVSFDNAGHSTNARCCDRCDRRSLSTSPVDAWQCFTDSGDYTRRFPSRSAGSFLPCLSECKHPAAFRALRALFGGL